MEAAGRDWGNNPEDCPVCLTPFDDFMQRPRTLPCGHTVCTMCTNNLKKQGRGRVICVECRASHAVPKGGQFPVCYTIEAFVRRLREANVAPAAVLHPPCSKEGKGVTGAAGKKGAAGLSMKMRSFLQEQESSVVATIAACQETRSQLQQYRTTLTSWVEQHQQLEDKLQGLVDQSKGAKERLLQEESRAAAKEKEITESEQDLQAVREALRTPATEQEALAAVSAVFCCLEEAEQEMKQCRECFPDASTVTAARKVRVMSSAALKTTHVMQAALETPASGSAEEVQAQLDPGTPQPHPDPDSTIMGRLQFIMGVSLTAEDLRNQTQATLRLLQAGRVFAVQQVEGELRHAKISIEAGRLYLHALKEQPPPEGVATLQMSEIVPSSPPCTVFLDLSRAGSSPRRVQIFLDRDTPRGRQFIMLCTGERGPSYVNTRLFWLFNKGKPGECVFGGDYEKNDGGGSCRLLPGLDEGNYKRSGRAGAVRGLKWTDPTRSVCGQFGICTRDREEGDEWQLVFGEVVDGLSVVAEAAQHSNIRKVTVVDCGVVVSEPGTNAPSSAPLLFCSEQNSKSGAKERELHMLKKEWTSGELNF